VDLRRRVQEPEPQVSGPVMAAWMSRGPARGNYEPSDRPAPPAIFCPQCGEEVTWSPSGIPGASSKYSMVPECSRHGVCVPVNQYGERPN
jgi:hypothetical protein